MPDLLKFFMRILRPLPLLTGMLFYALGMGAAHYLALPVDWSLGLLGWSVMLALQVGWMYLQAFFEWPNLGAFQDDDPPLAKRYSQDMTRRLGMGLLQIALVSLVVAAIGAFYLLRSTPHFGVIGLLLAIGFMIVVVGSIPPLRLGSTAYADLLVSFFTAGLIPALALAVQAGELHPLILFVSLPLMLLNICMYIALSLPEYAADLKHRRDTLVIRLTWQKAMGLHNLLILSAFVLVGLFAALRLPWSISWPMLLPLPLGLFAIWQMMRIAAGDKPRWNLLRVTSIGLVVIMAYLVGYALWMG